MYKWFSSEAIALVLTMTSYGLCLALVLAVQTCAVHGQGDSEKGSLTVVVDDSASMLDSIQQLRTVVSTVFGEVSSENATQIENLVLVSFNDPDAQIKAITTGRNEFERAIAGLRVHGGGDCPEYALKGIELGLTASLPHSYLYVLTDASAKDHGRFEEIKSLAQEKKSQLNFVLSGTCGSAQDDDFQVYYKLAAATNGRVFFVTRRFDCNDLLQYVKDTMTGKLLTGQ